MARSIWNGAVSFAGIDVPVKVFGATDPQGVHFRELHEPDGAEIAHKLVDADGHEVDRKQVAKGFEVRSGEYDTGDGYVMLTDDELAVAQPEKTRTIDVAKFVDLDEIDPILFDHPYYLLPAGEGQGPLRAYRLLVDVMDEAGKVAIGQFVLRTKEYLAAVRARDGLLALTTMLFQHEIRPTDELDLPTRKRPSKTKVDQAVALVEALGADFDHATFKDRYRRRLRQLVKDKEAGETIKAPPAPKSPGPPPDIMEALKASLDEVRAGS